MLLAFSVCFSCVLYNFNAKFTILSLKNGLIPHLIEFCRFEMRNGENKQKGSCYAISSYFIATNHPFIMTSSLVQKIETC